VRRPGETEGRTYSQFPRNMWDDVWCNLSTPYVISHPLTRPDPMTSIAPNPLGRIVFRIKIKPYSGMGQKPRIDESLITEPKVTGSSPVWCAKQGKGLRRR
jgi:hypothetical protein